MELGNKCYGIIAVLIIVIIFFYSMSLINEGDTYKEEYLSCVNKYNNLTQEYNNILKVCNTTATSQVEDYNILVNKYNDLLDEYLHFKDISLSPPYVQITNREIKLNFHFENETSVQTWTWPLESLEDSFYKGQIMREKEINEMNQYLPGTSQKFNSTRYLLIDNQMVIDLRPYVEKEHFGNFAKTIHNKYNTDEKRINSVWYILTSLNEYTTEIEETPRLPLETLLGAGGDCEDTAVLFASILKSMNSNWDVDLVYVDLENLENPKNINHVLVYVDTGTYSTYIETTTNIEINPYKTITGYHYTVK